MRYIKKLLCCMAVMSTLWVGIGYSYAQEKQSVLFVAPNRVVIEPKDRIKTVVVNNKSDKVRRYDITVVNQVMNEQGLTTRKDNFEYSARPMLRFVPKRFTLNPGERQVVRVMVRRPPNLSDGDYHSHMLFREVPERDKNKKALLENRNSNNSAFEIRALYGIAVPVFVQQGKIESSIAISDAKLLNNSSLAMSFARTGNAEASALLRAQYTPPGAQQAVDIMKERWVRMYREVDQISKVYELKFPEGVSLQSGGEVTFSLVKPISSSREKVDVLQTQSLKLQ